MDGFRSQAMTMMQPQQPMGAPGMTFAEYLGQYNPGIMEAIRAAAEQQGAGPFSSRNLGGGGGMGGPGGGLGRFMPGNPGGGGGDIDSLRQAIAQLRGQLGGGMGRGLGGGGGSFPG